MKRDLRTFKEFPKELLCPTCGTNEEGDCVLIPIVGTSDGNISEAQCFHLACAIPDWYDKAHGLIYKKLAT